MKKLFPILLFTLFLTGCDNENENTGYNDPELDKYILENYLHDAKQLYLHEIFNNKNHPNYNNPTIDKREVVKILKIIQAVYFSTTAERDSVFEKYQIHGYYCYGLNHLYLKVNTESPAIKKLTSNEFPTGNPSLDKILYTYHFDSTRTFYSYPDFPWLVLFTSHEYNMIPLEEKFESIESIESAELEKGCVGDGNTITLQRNAGSATITFSLGAGDCPAGCIYHKYWEFEVSNGTAMFIRTY